MKKVSSKGPRSQGTGNGWAVQKVTLGGRKALLKKGKAPNKSEGKSASSKTRSVKPTPVKSRENNVAQSPTAPDKKTPALKRELTPPEIQFQKQLAQFESGVKLFNQGELSKARKTFERLASASAPDLAQRARVYISICNQRLTPSVLHLKTADDYYNYAVSMTNQGHPEEAEQYLNKALKLAPKSDYIYYALATAFALRKNVEATLDNLQKAIQLNDRNRYLAQNDSDFADLGEDPRFTELLYPERPIS